MTRMIIHTLFCFAVFVPMAPSLSSELGPAAIEETEGRPRVSAYEAATVIDRKAFVTGHVKSIIQRGRIHLINFEDDEQPPFQAVITSTFRDAFPASLEEAYVGRNLQLYGWVSSYAGRPQMRLRSPEQILRTFTLNSMASPAVPHSRLKLATFNVCNLFDNYNDPYRNEETTPVKPREEMERLAEAIRELDADVLALQEVENRGILKRFVEVFLSDLGYAEIVHFEGNDVRGIDVALLSRFPIGRVTSHRHMTFQDDSGNHRRLERDLLAVEILPHGYAPFEVWVVHLKSNWDGRTYAEPIRVAEARFVRTILDRRMANDPDARIALCGDFNDTWGSRTLEVFTAAGSGRLVHLFDDIPEADRITFNEEPYRSMIDFILVTPALANGYVAGSSRIHLGSVETIGSDHNPVSAEFRLTPKSETKTNPPGQTHAQLNAVLWMQTSAEFRALAIQAFSIARDRLENALRDKTWTAAIEQGPGYEHLPPAIILDLDETVLDNSPYQAWLVANGKSHESEPWSEWCRQAEAGILPGAIEFLREAAAEGVEVFYITNRDHTLRDATIKNLERLGIEAQPRQILMLGDAPGGSDKTERRKMVAASYRVVLMVGDDFNDFLKAQRTTRRGALAMEHHHRWSRQWIILPNPAYGSWERALYGFDHSIDESERNSRILNQLQPWKREQQEAEVLSRN